MAFESLDKSQLYPLYSDMENSDSENIFAIPSRAPITRRRHRHLKSATPPRRRHIPHFHPMITHPLFSPKPNTLSPLSAIPALKRRHKRNKRIPGALKTNKKHSQTNTKQRQRPKRRIRTFYSKKWGNKLYGLTGNYPITTNTQNRTQSDRDRDRDTDLWQNNQSSLSLSYIDDQTLDLTDLHSLRSPSVSPMADDSVLTYDYDSAVSNIAANTDIDDDEAIDRFRTLDQPSHFKIIVSGPDRDHMDDMEEIIYFPSDDESASGVFSSSEDDETLSGDELMQRSSLFLSGNNVNVGVYSDFGLTDCEQSETDYMSAQSGDFDELMVCYHKRKEKNIKFRDNYLSDIGPSDIGSSDTDYFSSADSIPDSVPSSIPDSVDDTMPPQIHFKSKLQK